MKRIFFLLLVVVLAACSKSTYEKLDDGVVVNLAGAQKNAPKTLKIQFVSADIVHVQGFDAAVSETDTSLIVPRRSGVFTDWTLTEESGLLKLASATVTAEVSLKTGQVKFFDKDGNLKLSEVPNGGKTLEPFADGDVTRYRVRQMFDSPEDEAFYGLGQHQNGEFNYKGLDVELLQNNIVAVVPFVFSNKNYGILWDNYSITRFGDPRAYEPVSTLILKDKNGKEGGLTASYFNATGEVVVERQENVIDYENLETYKNTPEGYEMNAGNRVVWEGEIGSNVEGLHKFRLWAGGYSKLWINDQLMFDKWRQCWNPWYNKFYLTFKKGETQKIKMEWDPDANVSYFGLKYLDSKNEADQSKLSLFSESGKQLNYYYINGNNADEIISGYRDLTGKATIVPKWALGFWQSRERYRNWVDLVGVVKEYRKRKIPFDNIVLDWQYWPEAYWGDHDFDPNFFPEPEKNIQAIHDQNAQIMISVWPKFVTNTENYKKFEKEGWLFTKNVELGNLDWVGPGYLSTFYDAYNPEARAAFWDGINEKLYSKGVDAWWLDATEPDIHSNVTLAEKKSTLTPNHFGSGEEFFNTYSLLQAKGVYEGQRASDPNKRVFILTRSVFAGQQNFGAVTWSGDIVSRWGDLSDQVRAGLNMSLSGIPYWTTDIGGFAVEKRYERQDPAHLDEWRELNMRWFQYGTFTPLFRVHGQFPFREMWNIAPEGSEVYEAMVYYTQLRYRLMPYVYALAGQTYHQNYTIMRPLIMDFASDVNVKNIGDQFMFGPSIMICPVTTYKQREREVYLPAGSGWFDFNTGAYYEGGNSIRMNAPLNRVPMLVKAGSIVPFGPEIQYAMQETKAPLKVVVFTGADAKFELYEDAGINYNYEKGEFETLSFAYNQTTGELKVSGKVNGVESKFQGRDIEVYFIDAAAPQAFDLNQKAAKVVKYVGEELVVAK